MRALNVLPFDLGRLDDLLLFRVGLDAAAVSRASRSVT